MKKMKRNPFRLNREEREFMYNYIQNNKQLWENIDRSLKLESYRVNLESEILKRLAQSPVHKVEACILYNLLDYIRAINCGAVKV